MRMSSASTPPTRKKTKAVTMYMIPIFLWSTVVTQSVHPRPRGVTARAAISGTGRRAVVVGVSTAAIGLSSRSGVGGQARLRGGRRRLVAVARHGRLLGLLDEALLAHEPRLVLVRGHGPHAGDHVRVVAPAQLGALAAEDRPGLVAGDLEPGLVRVAGDRVHLAAQLRDPPGVRDVLADDVQDDGGVDGDDHLLVGVG